MTVGCLHRFTRAAYYGGRVEVFRESFNGPGVLNYGDVNSMYPWAMLGPVPTELSFVREGDPDFDWAARDHLGFVECTVRIPLDCYLPPLPFRTRGRLIFPVGTFSGVWTSEELATLPRIGGEIVSHERSVWFRGQEVFANFVRHWYQYRDKTAPGYSLAMDMVAKLFLNSLYGKFGMNSEREKLWFFPTDEEFAEHELTPMPNAPVQFGAYTELTESEPPYVIPHIAAWVTSRSRVRWWSLAMDMLDNGHQLYYGDTDSLVTSAPILDSTALGDLKTVCQILRGKFVAPKMYFIQQADGDEFVKAKGFSGGFGAKGLTEAEFDGLVKHRLKIKVSRMRKLREGIRGKERFPAMKRSLKGLRSGLLDEKRIHLPDGNTTPIDATGLQCDMDSTTNGPAVRSVSNKSRKGTK